MVVKIAYLLLALAIACSCLDGGIGDRSKLDPKTRLGLTLPSRDEPGPKIEPMALTRRQVRGPGFKPLRPGKRKFWGPRILPPNPRRVNFGIRVNSGRYAPEKIQPNRNRGPYSPEPGVFIPRQPYVIRRPVVPPPDIIFVDRVYPVGNPHPVWNHGIIDQLPFRPGMNNGPHNYGQRPRGNGPDHWVPRLPRPGGNIGRHGPPPRKPNNEIPDYNQANNTSKDGDQKKDLPDGTVGVTVAAVNLTAQGTVHANVTVFVVPKEGDDKETLQTAAQSIINNIFNKDKDEEKRRKQ